MLREFVQSIQELAASGEQPHIVHLSRKESALVIGGQIVEKLPRMLPPRRHQAATLESLLFAVSCWGKEEEFVIFQSPDRIVAVLDDSERFDTVTLALAYSERWQALHSLIKGGGALDHKQLIRLLNVTLRGGVNPTLVAQLRQINFTAGQTGGSGIQHGRESMGRSVEASVLGTADIPESFLVSVPVYSNADLREPQQVELTLEIDVGRQSFNVLPAADELTRGQQAMATTIRERCIDKLGECVLDGVPNFLGLDKMLSE